MEHVVDEQGRSLRSPDAITTLVKDVEQALAPKISAVTVEQQEWSASGGLHLAGTWRATGTPVLIKLGVNPNQIYWTQQIAAAAPDLVPTLYVSGDHLGELRVGWTVLERIAYGPLGPGWNGAEFDMLLAAAVSFQRAARTVEPRHVTTVDASKLRHWLEAGRAAGPPGPVEIIMDRLEQDFAWVASVCAFEICHGDVHMCNALARTPPPYKSDAVLIDCQPRRQPWAFDAAYPQLLNSIDKSRVGYRDLVRKMARVRSAYGMQTCDERDLERLSRITLAWLAIRLWGLCLDRHTIRDYRDETERYIAESAELTT